MGCVGEWDGECERRLADRGPSAAPGGGHEVSKKKVNILPHARGTVAPALTLFHTPMLALGAAPRSPDPDPQPLGLASNVGSRGPE
jgi:hypothetical protein